MPGLLWLKWHVVFFFIQLHKIVCQAFTECTSFSKMCAHHSKNLRLNVLSCKFQQLACTAIPGHPKMCLGKEKSRGSQV